MFGAYKFRDLFAEIATGLLPTPTGFTAGSVAGNAIAMSPFAKLFFQLYCGSGSPNTQVGMWLTFSSASGGTFTSAGNSVSLITMSTAPNSLGFVADIEVRGEFMANFAGSNYLWVKPVVSVSAGSANGCVLCKGFVSDYDPASNFDTPAAYTNTEVDLF